MSGIASSQNIYTDEELKSKARLYQQAAGVFANLCEKMSLLIAQEPTSVGQSWWLRDATCAERGSRQHVRI